MSSWEGKAPKCKEGQCSSDQTEVALSTTGSGGTYCNAATVKLTLTGQEATYEERPYCCKQDDNTKWSDCQWYDNVGTLMDASIMVDGFCWSGCPYDRVRVALDQHGGGCKGDGGRAKCCVPKYTTVSKRSYTDSEKNLEASVEEFMDDPSCGLDDYVMKRDLAGITYSMGNISLSDGAYSLSTFKRRASSKAREDMDELMFQLFVTYTANAAAQEIWKKHVVSVFPNLAVQTVRAYINTAREWVEQGTRAFLDLLACNMALFNSKLGDLDVVSCKCTTKNCCDSTGEGACSDNPDDDGLSKRDLEKRARSNTLRLDDGRENVMVVSWEYPRRGAIPPNDPILNAIYEYANADDCLNTDIGTTQIGVNRITFYQIKHIMELNTIVRFLRNAHAGTLPSGATARNGRLSATFVRQALDAPILNNPPVMTGGDQSLIPISRAMHALGSNLNSADFTLLLTRLNNVKSREPLTVLAYLNHPVVNSRMISTSNTVRAAWGLADEAWENGGNAGEFAQDWWDEWIRDSLKHDAKRVREWVEEWAKKMVQYWAVRTGDQAQQVNEILVSLRRLASDAEIGVTGLD
ncbi:chitin-binding, type 1 [Aspergillus terreus]|uniref:Chitin-binding, type 1 n=1 Tax=Aspergillus terreus TaxID=33178 RepID=A0A5M3ZDP2_ASPTE|nr:hypothetical protein ATETN484_0014028600 [Aspergillus terreus]GFF20952.1 chitin-binding, type 1 [Aspergillus terreus]